MISSQNLLCPKPKIQQGLLNEISLNNKEFYLRMLLEQFYKYQLDIRLLEQRALRFSHQYIEQLAEAVFIDYLFLMSEGQKNRNKNNACIRTSESQYQVWFGLKENQKV